MAQLEPSSDDLTHAANRREIAAKLWSFPGGSAEWVSVVSCIIAVRHENPGRWDRINASTLFTLPDRHPEFLDAVIVEYFTRKLIGETT